MSDEPARTVTRLLEAVHRGDAESRERLVELLAADLHLLAERHLRRERPGHTLRPTELVNEVFLRLLEGDVLAQAPNRAYLFGAASQALRRVLVDYARQHQARKRGGDWQRTPFDEALENYERKQIDLSALHEALELLETLNPRHRQVIDEYHFGGFTMREIAEHLGVSETTVSNDFKRAQLWLAARIGQEP